MALALTLARRGLGRVWPNPAVGCVIVDEAGHIAGRGWTQDGGRPHAETQALRQAGARAKGATAYVSLEPCAHQGQTPPCAQALIDAGVTRVVSALDDPDSRVAGKGHAILQAAGIELRAGVLAAEARALNAGFLSRIQRERPSVTLKLATTLDSRIALLSGESRWITGDRARAHGHLLRSQHDAIMVGIGTALADDAELTCRLPGVNATGLVRIVVDSAARLELTSKLVTTAMTQPVWLLTSPAAEPAAVAALRGKGVKVIEVGATLSRVDLSAALKAVAAEGLTRVLVEGGATLASSLLKARLVDRLYWYRAPSLMGDGVSAVTSLGTAALGDLPRFVREETMCLGEDVLEVYRTPT
ncbi:MAG: bifunctional diaminohydroxyphosphoribosylaminopyrimidine deaminase/5-amino-6-(5-phosphoribosylamino)uracil reductase RibD [Alphaproteobacteria bacterium]|nr:bifunctional diaminohydroxyphosphoribosylaminopyrimidine deaminase/5-amino-6-(5-phosphoribosylamino)uracil reductase RibD [Alphaproteobacteria bacterium]